MADRKVPTRPRKTPAYRLHKPTGQAVVRIDGRDHYLGRHGTEASHEKYRRLIAEWLTAGVHSRADPGSSARFGDLTINEVVLAFWQHAERHHRDAEGSASRESTTSGTPCARYGSFTGTRWPASSVRWP